MRSVEIAGSAITLSDPDPDYQLLIEQVRADTRTVLQDEWLEAGHKASTIGYWTGEAGLQWNDPRSERARRIRDHHLRGLAIGTVLDLGCGEQENVERTRQFMAPYRPKRYIGVDHLSAYSGLQKRIARFGLVTPLEDRAEDGSHGAVVQGDMLQVLSRLRTGSVNAIALNGIDSPIVNPDTPYGRAVTQEVTRVVRHGGLVWGVALTSGLLSRLKNSPDFRPSPEPGMEPVPNFIPMPLRASNDRQRAALWFMGTAEAGYYFLTKEVRSRQAQGASPNRAIR